MAETIPFPRRAPKVPPASRTEAMLLYAGGVVQGLALVSFPATSAIFTSPDGFGFGSTQYGSLFLPQFVMAILSSAVAPRIAKTFGLRSVLLLGLALDLVAMAAFSLSPLLIGNRDAAFVLLCLATTALGFGFGSTVTALNTFVEAYNPVTADRAVLALNALLGVGTALAPLLVAIFVGFAVWWLLPVVLTIAAAALLAAVLAQPFRLPQTGRPAATTADAGGMPARFWFYGAAVFVYGILETLSGNWATIYLTGERGVPAEAASLALTAFWAMVTIGRILVGVASKYVAPRWIYVALPLLILVAGEFAAVAHSEAAGILAFGLVGLGCSAMLPLSISFAGDEFPQLSATTAGWLIALYQLGYGVAAFGVGPVEEFLGASLSEIFAASGVLALALAGTAAAIVRGRD